MAEKISIITISYNSKNTIEKTILSILGQSYRPLEYVFVDGGSKDGTINLIKKYIPELEKAGIEVNYKSEPDKGISDAFNKGIQRSSGDIIGIINSDDQLMDEALMKIADAFTPTVDIVCGDCLWIDAERNLQYIRKSKMQLKKLKYEMVLMHPTCFVRRTAYEKWGYFDINLRYIMDKDLMARFYSSILFQNMPKEAKLLIYEQVGQNVCLYCNRNFIEDLKIVKNRNGRKPVGTFELDHFYSKDEFPMFAVSFYNLIPVCGTCNRIKSNTVFNINPYLMYDKKDNISFEYNILGSN